VLRAASPTAWTKSAMIELTRTSRRGSALRRESSLRASKRVKRSCQATRRAREVSTASLAPLPMTNTAQVEPKQENDALASLIRTVRS